LRCIQLIDGLTELSRLVELEYFLIAIVLSVFYVASSSTPLHKSDTAEFRQREEKAEQIAMEIERGIDHGVRSALENGDNEEMAFSAVQRPSPVPVSSPSAASPHLSIHRNASPGSSQSAGNGSGKYVAPHMRNNQSQPSTTSVPLQRPQHLAQIVSSPVSSSVASATISTSGGPGPVAAASLTPVAAVAAVSKPSVEAVPESTHGEPRVNGV
jgi:ataxin 2/2L